MQNTPDLTAFNETFHNKIDYNAANVVSSPLGVWLALAQAASPAPQNIPAATRVLLEKTLGTDLGQARTILDSLLVEQPPALRLAMGAWAAASLDGDPGYKAWTANLPSQVTQCTPIPTKIMLDEWVEMNSFGILKEFPATERDLREMILVLANVLATKFNWRKPFTAVENKGGHWQSRELLHADSNQQDISLVLDETGNLYGVVTNRDDTGVAVHAVIAANPALPPVKVIAFAEAYTRHPFTTPLADVAAHSAIHTMRDVEAAHDHYTATLPAWEVTTTHDLGKMGLPLLAAARGVTIQDIAVSGVQVAAAAYNKRGFEAAAVTAIMMRAAAMMPRITNRKEVTVTFAHPFAVVAAQGYDRRQPDSAWANLPVFTAWVRTAAEVTDRDFSA